MLLHVNRSTQTPSQWELLTSIRDETNFATLYAGGFGSGKTTGLLEAMLLLKSINGAVPGLVIAQSYPALKAVLLRGLRRMLSNTLGAQRARELCRIHDPTGERYLDLGDGVPIFLRSATHPDGLDGIDVGWEIGDEVRHWSPESMNVAMARVRVRCPKPLRVFASVPQIGHLSEEFRSGRAGRRLIKAPTIQNARNLAPGFVDGLKQSYSLRMQSAYLGGEFVMLEGAVYEQIPDEFWRSPWAVDAQYVPSRRTELWCDPGYRRSAWLVVQELAPLSWVVIDEVGGDHTSDWAIVNGLNAAGYEFDRIVCDPAASATQSAFGVDTLQVLKGLHGRHDRRPPVHTISDPWRDINVGVDKLRVLLGDPANKIPIRLRVAKHLEAKERGMRHALVKSLQGYRYPEHKGVRLQSDPLKDGINDHFCDALRYGAVVLWLTTDLRKIDPRLADQAPGYRVA